MSEGKVCSLSLCLYNITLHAVYHRPVYAYVCGCVWSVITGSWSSMLKQTYPRDWPFEINKQTSDWPTQPTELFMRVKKKKKKKEESWANTNRNTCCSLLSPSKQFQCMQTVYSRIWMGGGGILQMSGGLRMSCSWRTAQTIQLEGSRGWNKVREIEEKKREGVCCDLKKWLRPGLVCSLGRCLQLVSWDKENVCVQHRAMPRKCAECSKIVRKKKNSN